MKLFNRLVFPLAFSLMLSSCTGFGDGEISGNFEASEGSLLLANGNAVEEGNITLKLSYGVYGLKDPSISILQSGEELAQIPIPKSSFKNNQINVKGSAIGQDFDISAKRRHKILAQWTKVKEEESCTYAGSCYLKDTQSSKLSNQNTFDYTYGYHSDCLGTRWEKIEYKKKVVTLDLYLLNPETQEKIAYFDGELDKPFVDAKIIEHGECE